MGKRKRKAAATLEAPVAKRHGFDAGGLLGHESTFAVNVTEHVALGIDTVLACVRTIADLTADALVAEYRGDERLDVQSRIVRRPMATITRRTWIWVVAATMALYNGCYLWRRFGRDSEGVVLTLEPLAPSRVAWIAGDPYIDGQKADASELVWVPRMTFPTVTRELGSILRLAREAFAAAASADAVRSGFWETGGSPGIYISVAQEIDATEADAIRDRYVERRTSNPGTPPVFGKGGTLETVGADMAAEGANMALSGMGTSIARYFGVPAWLVNVPNEAGNLTYANASAAGLDLVRYTLQPGYAGPIADAWSGELPGDYLIGRRVVLDLTHLTRGTILEQFQAYQIATGGQRFMLPSEVRSDLHLPMDMTLDDAGTPAPALEAIDA